MDSFGARLRMLREENHLTQKDIAKIIGITDNAIGNYERGTRTPDKDALIALSKIFNVSIDYLLCVTDIRHQAEDLIRKGIVKVEEPTEIEKISSELPEQERQELKSYARYLHTKSKLNNSEKESSATSEAIEEEKVN